MVYRSLEIEGGDAALHVDSAVDVEQSILVIDCQLAAVSALKIFPIKKDVFIGVLVIVKTLDVAF